jgi:hypothetical protein
METMSAVVEEAEVCKISNLFRRKPPGLGFNETDALVIKARLEDGRQIGATFYFSLKPDGTFEEEPMGRDAVKARRHKLASFLRYYGVTEDVDKYKLKDRISEFIGGIVSVVPIKGELSIYIPGGDVP